MLNIPFCIPDIQEEDIAEVVDTLRSGWITTGPKTEKFSRELAAYLDCDHCVALASGTSALELSLRAYGIGPGDEVITSPYTYAATINAIIHTGATPVLADIAPGTYELDPAALALALTPRSKAVIAVDIGGWPCDYTALRAIIDSKRELFVAANPLQKQVQRCLLIGDCAHALGASLEEKRFFPGMDIGCYSFHAVKNLTTAEGGALAFQEQENILDGETVRWLKQASLHGQNKDALAKYRGASWRYDIRMPGYKCNMTDIQAALGLGQLARYPKQLARRHHICRLYRQELADTSAIELPVFADDRRKGSCHFFPVRLADEKTRDTVIESLRQDGIQANVHFQTVNTFSAYKTYFGDRHWPHAEQASRRELSLPVYPALADEQVSMICSSLQAILG